MSRFWMIRAGAGSVHAKAFEDAGVVGIGWIRAGNITSLDTPETVRARIEASYPAASTASRNTSYAQLNKFRNVVARGDRVVTYDGTTREYLLGTVTGDYEYRPEGLEHSPNVRSVRWEGRVPKAALRRSSINTLGAILTVFEPGEDVLHDLDDALRTGRTTPPSGDAGVGDTEDLEALFEEFVTTYLSQEVGIKHVAAYKQCIESGQANMQAILHNLDAGEVVTDLVLERLLPHSESENHRNGGHWVHIAPAINKDIRTWYEGAGLSTPEAWPGKAMLILKFVREVTDHPDELAAACSAFAESPLSKGLQCGMLTPILNALRPDRFAIVNRKVIETMSALTGRRLTPSISAYADANEVVMQFVADNAEIFGQAEDRGVPSLMAFDMLAHWYVAVREDEDESPASGRKRTANTSGRGSLDRVTKETATHIVERICPDGTPRSEALEFMARSIHLAHEIAPNGWSITLKERLVRLNVGGIFSVDLRQGSIGLVAHEPSLSESERLAVSGYADDFIFRWLPDMQSYTVPYAEMNPALVLMRKAHDEALRQAADKSQKAPQKASHSPGVLRMLRALGHAVPDPGYAGSEQGNPVPTDTEPVQRKPSSPIYTAEQAAEDTFIPVSQFEKWLRMINRKGQAILYGPPGTGKTYVAERLAHIITGGGDGVIELVQFHPSYAYEDFIQGIRPRTGVTGSLTYEMIPGRFLEFCRRASECSGPSVLIIDEINRANLASVFGELMYLLEYRDKHLALAGGATLRIPANVRIIGTMNTADRSVALVDHALRRRFGFIPLAPDFTVLSRYHAKHGKDYDSLIDILEKLNRQIGDPHLSVGISYFMRETLSEDLQAIWEGEVEPYVEELFFDRRKELDPFRWSAIKDSVV